MDVQDRAKSIEAEMMGWGVEWSGADPKGACAAQPADDNVNLDAKMSA